jgi:hypothetical protein
MLLLAQCGHQKGGGGTNGKRSGVGSANGGRMARLRVGGLPTYGRGVLPGKPPMLMARLKPDVSQWRRESLGKRRRASPEPTMRTTNKFRRAAEFRYALRSP